MRQFKIPLTNLWVDLDTIQSIYEPSFDRYDNAVICWQHAFRSDTSQVNFGRRTLVNEAEFRYGTEEYNVEQERVIKEWHQHGLERYYTEVFVPFFTAWSGQAPS